MNKALAISLLVICNLAAVCALSIFYLIPFGLIPIPVLALLICLAAVVAVGFASSRILSVFERKYSLKMRWFILASYVPSIIGAAICWIVYLYLDSKGYFTGFFPGLGELVFTIMLSISAVAYLISGVIWCAVSKHRSKAKNFPK